MAQVVHADRPHLVLYDGPNPEEFIANNEPRPHAMDGVPMPQLVVKGEEKKED
jgi:hypothetical protein